MEIDDRLPQGDIRWGFLYLDPSSGRFDIDRKMVDSHISELRKQLSGKSKSIIDWIQGKINFPYVAGCRLSCGHRGYDQVARDSRVVVDGFLSFRVTVVCSHSHFPPEILCCYLKSI